MDAVGGWRCRSGACVTDGRRARVFSQLSHCGAMRKWRKKDPQQVLDEVGDIRSNDGAKKKKGLMRRLKKQKCMYTGIHCGATACG